jgi:glycosyltransferase involved in cell wall biosynthesis
MLQTYSDCHIALPRLDRSSIATPRAIRIAVLIPCYNEELTVARVVADFHASLPNAVVYVYDNNSSDGTRLVARAAGAVVRREPLQGKGHVVRRMFADVEADAYVLVDGDDTYAAEAAAGMVRMLLADQLDMVTAARLPMSDDAYRPGHRIGNGCSVSWSAGYSATVSATCSRATACSAAASSNRSRHSRPDSRRKRNSPSTLWN